MNGKKKIAIITEVAGISLQVCSLSYRTRESVVIICFLPTQEDQRVNNPRPRVYISLECPPSTGLAIQQFGCVHRTGRNKQVTNLVFYCNPSVLSDTYFSSAVGQRSRVQFSLFRFGRRKAVGIECRQKA